MFSIIVAIAENGVIGQDNKMPWHYKEDLAYFKRVTDGHVVLMGRKTFESIISYLGRPLPGRISHVLTRNEEFTYEGVRVIHDLYTYIEQYKESAEEIFIIGGASIYEKFMPYAKKLYITHIHKSYVGDTYFPDIPWENFRCLKETKNEELTFSVYERV